MSVFGVVSTLWAGLTLYQRSMGALGGFSGIEREQDHLSALGGLCFTVWESEMTRQYQIFSLFASLLNSNQAIQLIYSSSIKVQKNRPESKTCSWAMHGQPQVWCSFPPRSATFSSQSHHITLPSMTSNIPMISWAVNSHEGWRSCVSIDISLEWLCIGHPINLLDSAPQCMTVASATNSFLQCCMLVRPDFDLLSSTALWWAGKRDWDFVNCLSRVICPILSIPAGRGPRKYSPK